MPADRNRSALPREIVRDLLGITRALYRAELAGARDPGRLARLEDIGKTYRRALDLSRGDPDTMGHRASWSWAEKATAALGAFVADGLDVAPAVAAAAARLSRRGRIGN